MKNQTELNIQLAQKEGDATKDERFSTPIKRGKGVRSSLCIPLILHGERLGVLNLGLSDQAEKQELTELANLPTDIRLTADELAEIDKLGNNEGCMKLKGASERNTGEEELRPDTWPVRPELLEIASRYQLNPAW